MKKFITLGIAFLLVLVTLTGCDSHERILWAQNLSVNDIERIEAIRMPSNENERYRNFEQTEFARIVEIINNAKGEQVENPELLAGGGITFYITMLDGTRHTFRNNGNVYLVIDGVSFNASYDWLSSWLDEPLNSRVPDDFEY